MHIDGKTKLYGIVGRPVSHSLSPAMHNSAFQALGENSVYLPFPVEDVAAALTGLKGLGIGGVSVTIPHKQAVMPHLDQIDPVARRIGAINTIICVRQEDRVELHGLNTDWLGANRALEERLPLSDASVVLLGAGGSARAIGYGLLEAGSTLTLCSRTETRGRQLADELGCPWVSLTAVEQLSADILVHATSVGMAPEAHASLVPKSSLGRYRLVMDIVYAPLQTQLLKDADEAGCLVVNGLEMLLYQGVAQFELWTGRKAPVEVMREALMKASGNL